ncbi:MAG: hypothetical protein AAB364_00045 [Patescibacteria group bacterium]
MADFLSDILRNSRGIGSITDPKVGDECVVWLVNRRKLNSLDARKCLMKIFKETGARFFGRKGLLSVSVEFLEAIPRGVRIVSFSRNMVIMYSVWRRDDHLEFSTTQVRGAKLGKGDQILFFTKIGSDE